MKRLVLISLLLFAAVAISVPGFSDINQTMSYQGQLTDSGGSPLNGTKNLRFVIYDALTGGNILWSETHNSVPVINGIFNIILGQGTVPMPIKLAMRKNLFLEIRVDHTGAGAWETMSPRHSLVCGAYAMSTLNVVHRQVLTVAHHGGDTTTASRAIDMLLGVGGYTAQGALSPTPSADTPWVIEVKAGDFIEPGTTGGGGTIVIPDYVTLRGQGWDATELRTGGIGMAGVGRALEALFINCTFDSSTVINMNSAMECYVREVKVVASCPVPIIDMSNASFCEVMENHMIGHGPMSAQGIMTDGMSESRIEDNVINLNHALMGSSGTMGSYGISDNGAAMLNCFILENTIRYVTTGVAGPGPSYGIGLSGSGIAQVSYNVFMDGTINKDIIDANSGNPPLWTAPGTGEHGIDNQHSDGTRVTSF
ncbi:hypothetical protein K8S19_05075 [bacterium]|nr:hypothetical protein [bacterium]